MKAITVGSATIDIIALIADNDVERMTMHNATSSFLLLEQGKKVDASSISTHVGGGAVNAAISLKRLGIETEVLVKIGDDLNGKKVLEAFNEAGLGKDKMLQSREAGTGTSVMVASHDRNVSIFTSRGANTLIRPEEIRDFDLTDIDFIYISNLSEGTRDCLPYLVGLAKKTGTFIATNPGIRQLTEQPKNLLDCLANIDLLTINLTEASSLAPHLFARAIQSDTSKDGKRQRNQLPSELRRGLSVGSFTMLLVDFLQALLKQGPTYIAVTDGVDGSFVAGPQGIHYCPSLRCKVSGTAGAGDAFASTLTGFIAIEKTIEIAMQAASINAASVVGYIDTQTGLLESAALEAQLNAHAKELSVSFWSWAEIT